MFEYDRADDDDDDNDDDDDDDFLLLEEIYIATTMFTHPSAITSVRREDDRL